MNEKLLFQIGEIVATEIESVAEVTYSDKIGYEQTFIVSMVDGKKFEVTLKDISI